MSKVVFFGASGSIGSAIAAELIARGHEVTGVSRSGTSPVEGVRTVTGDASSATDVATLVASAGAEAVVSTIGPRHDGSDPLESLGAIARALVDGLRQAGVERLIVVGGAGSLKQGGSRHVDNPHFPQALRCPGMTEPETRDYLTHHLRLAGRSDPLFSDDATTLIHQTSRGLPRAVNNLALQAVVATYATNKTIVDATAARAAITEVTTE